jgi:hypothetical protein
MGGRGSFTDAEMLPRRGSPVEGSMGGREHCLLKEHGSKLDLRRKIEGRKSFVEEEALQKREGRRHYILFATTLEGLWN